jgi:hypothetical protein
LTEPAVSASEWVGAKRSSSRVKIPHSENLHPNVEEHDVRMGHLGSDYFLARERT